jgi:hypothetical protein
MCCAVLCCAVPQCAVLSCAVLCYTSAQHARSQLRLHTNKLTALVERARLMVPKLTGIDGLLLLLLQGALMVNDEELLQGFSKCRDLGAIPQVRKHSRLSPPLQVWHSWQLAHAQGTVLVIQHIVCSRRDRWTHCAQRRAVGAWHSTFWNRLPAHSIPHRLQLTAGARAVLLSVPSCAGACGERRRRSIRSAGRF